MLHNIIIQTMRIANKLLPISIPELIQGEGSVAKSAETIIKLNGKKVFIVTDAVLVKLGVVKLLTDSLKAENVDYLIFDEVVPDPTIELIADGVKQYNDNHCDSFIAIGGGSTIDCAKGIAASVVKNVGIDKLAGLMRVRKAMPPFIAIPTTAGTGSEATVVSVVTDPIKKQKFTVIDPCLVPKVAIVDPTLMKSLPAKITAETGMDALTHAIESYISLHATPFTKRYSLDAMSRIFSFLPEAYADGNNLTAREEMSIASLNAGIAFTRTSIGYVHAIAHQFGGFYKVPHGLANAVILPHVLEFSVSSVSDKYAEMAIELGFSNIYDDELAAANKFIRKVKELNKRLNIQTNFPELQEQDIDNLASRAVKEAHYKYPVPKKMNQSECAGILKKLLPAA